MGRCRWALLIPRRKCRHCCGLLTTDAVIQVVDSAPAPHLLHLFSVGQVVVIPGEAQAHHSCDIHKLHSVVGSSSIRVNSRACAEGGDTGGVLPRRGCSNGNECDLLEAVE